MGEFDLESLDDSLLKDDSKSSDAESGKRSSVSPEALRRAVLAYVAEAEYDTAIEELRDFLDSDFEYPMFRARAERYVRHSIDLVNAIRAKKNFPGIASLTRAKSQELKERTRSHYNELDQSLKRIEKVETQLRIDDVKSTLWVVKSVSYSLIIILLVGLSMDLMGGFYDTAVAVIDDFALKAIDWFFRLIE